jgi:hypothetical protein
MNRVICGCVVRPGDGRHFEFEATVEPTGEGYTWIARVTSDGGFVGRLAGNLWKDDTPSAPAIDERVKHLVESLIVIR